MVELMKFFPAQAYFLDNFILISLNANLCLVIYSDRQFVLCFSRLAFMKDTSRFSSLPFFRASSSLRFGIIQIQMSTFEFLSFHIMNFIYFTCLIWILT